MASMCFYFKSFFMLFILYHFHLEALSESDSHLIAYDIGVPNHNTDSYAFVTLDRVTRQAPVDKKNDSPSMEKAKTVKKPTAMDLKPNINATDGEQKPNIDVKKELPPVKTSSTTPPSNAHPIHEEEHEKIDGEHNHTVENHVNSTESSVANSTAKTPPATKAPNGKTSDPVLTNITVSDDDLDVDKFLEVDFNDEFNEMIREHNITTQKVDYHLYYNSSIVTDSEVFRRYWVDMDKMKDVKNILSKSHRRAVTVKLNFEFPFYGHPIKKITIATGGFLFTGEYAHSWLSVTQYIAPFMADFITASSNSSIKHVDNGTVFTVQWENVVLQGKPEEGNFVFQCSLFKNGDIVFVYKSISVVIDNFGTNNHQIKVGVSDAYIIDRIVFLVRRKTIYEYHRVNIEKDEIKNGTVIMFNALDTCLDMKDCKSCVTELPIFGCNWCANRCSNGMDRYRQDWLVNGCNSKKKTTVEECVVDEEPLSFVPKMSQVESPEEGNNVNIGIAGIMGILFVICLALGVGIWLFYGYRNPHTPAGQFLIRYRPSQWSWRRGEARYTAATIHM